VLAIALWQESRRPVRFLRCLLGFLLGLIVTALLAYRLLPRDDHVLDEVVARASRCDVLFVGPSYLEVGLLPERFEAETQALERPLRACKFTKSALKGYELKHDLAQLMEQRWPALKYVAVDVTLLPSVSFERQNWFNPRMVHWHTWDALGAFGHLQHVAMNYLSIGRAGSLLSHARWLERATGRDQGYVPPRDVDRLPTLSNQARQEWTEERQDQAGRQLAQDKARERARRHFDDDAWPRELEPIIRARGFQPIFLYSPIYRNRMPPRPNRAGKKPLVFLDFDDPDRYTELYAPEARGRTSHLSQEGAVRYSRILAREFVKLASEAERDRPGPGDHKPSRKKRQRDKRERGKR
jgi:hypothetical protein